ncbi:MAG: hypothetical protein UT34_C0001G0215 [candidate division WS6 bacterium GW2011_GWF2_39_15]|uniref:Uncharacterized protein n=1 Tax=candidate division WS6 bacterium GW2011_GWF2_39_15 TaxID=1619100 RepID=A0A0G0Q6Y4_9BACT|nr:MAG: hypothetical protein UT34_C0001G0215 [candidate division WS6 bacterium GW2011_GWF2_39_15]
MLSNREGFSPYHLRSCLLKAKEKLDSIPGPHLKQRNELSPDWLGWWIDRFEQIQNDYSHDILIHHQNFATFYSIQYIIPPRLRPNYGTLFVAGFEGGPNHRNALYQISAKRYTPIIIFEQESYFELFKDRLPLLPLEIRMSMLKFFPGFEGIVTVSPTVPIPGQDLNQYYANLHRQTEAFVCFVDENDPNWEMKRNRGIKPEDATLTHFNVPSTSERVARLRPRDAESLQTTLFSGIKIPISLEPEEIL